jgi:hypothetical protein
MEALSFTAPMAYALDWIILFQRQKQGPDACRGVGPRGHCGFGPSRPLFPEIFRWEGFGGTEDLANHLIGAMLMGIGGVTAMGCTVGAGF